MRVSNKNRNETQYNQSLFPLSNLSFNKHLEMIVVSFLLFPALWMKIIFSFSASETENRGVSYFLFSISDMTIFAALVMWWLLHTPSKLSRAVIFLALLLFSLNIPALALGQEDIFLQLRLTLKILVPILFFVCILEFSKIFSTRFSCLVKITILLITLCTLYGLFFFPMEYNRGVEWNAGYFSGLHSTSYIWVGMFIALSGVARNEFSRFLFWCFALLLIGSNWGVRAAEGALIVFALFYLFDQVKSLDLKAVLFTSAAIAAIVFISGILIIPSFGEVVNKWSSGRLGMYVEKIEQISSSSTLTLMIGGGAGSDLIISNTWWWGKRGAHNDFLTILVEQGILYLGVFLTLLLLLIRSFREVHLRAVMYMYIFSSIVSNGFMVRPMTAYILFLAGVYASQNIRLNHPRLPTINRAN